MLTFTLKSYRVNADLAADVAADVAGSVEEAGGWDSVPLNTAQS